jgi:hypothetical protein
MLIIRVYPALSLLEAQATWYEEGTNAHARAGEFVGRYLGADVEWRDPLWRQLEVLRDAATLWSELRSTELEARWNL